MKSFCRGTVLIALALAMLAGMSVAAQSAPATTTVQDTVYYANGTPAQGTVVVSWGSFTTATGQNVPAGTTTVTLGSNGQLQVALVPNAGSVPMGSYYTAIFHLADGTESREYWVIPASSAGAAPETLSEIETQVLPASVAMQTVTKQYVDNAIAEAQLGAQTLDDSPYVLKTGDTMTGPLVLPGDPTTPTQAADKNYVDENVAPLTTGLSGKVSLLPSGTQDVTQPVQTQLNVNRLNGSLDATQFVNQSGINGIAGALASPECTTGCRVVADPEYPDTNDYISYSSVPSQSMFVDLRGGEQEQTSVNPLSPDTSTDAEQITSVSTRSESGYSTEFPSRSLTSGVLALTENALDGGSNLDPVDVETPPYFKSDYFGLALIGNYNTAGQHVQLNNDINCYGVGDCLAGSQVIESSGGARDPSDEGTHPYDLQVNEDGRVFTGTCSTGCTTGSTSLFVTTVNDGGTQGDGRFLIDTVASKDISTGSLTGGAQSGGANAYPFAVVDFTGTNFPVSVFLQMAASATSQPTNVAPGTVTVTISSSGVPSGFATSTTALPATSGVACIAMPDPSRFPNYEMAPYTVIDATHLQMTLNKPHAAGAVISVGGLCGYGLEETVDTQSGIRQLWPVVGSVSGTSLYYADAEAGDLGMTAFGTNAYANIQASIAAIARTNNVVTVTLASPEIDLTGLTMNVSGVTDSSYNGNYPVTMTSSTTLTYPDSGANSTSSGGTVSLLTGGYVLYPMAEVLSVYDPATKSVDGTLQLAPNLVPWSSGDTVEEPHYVLMSTYADTELISQTMPRPFENMIAAGKTYAGTVGPNVTGWIIDNASPASSYFGDGGTHLVPRSAYSVEGAWANDIEVTAGLNAVIDVHCNLYTCGRYDSGYNLFQLDAVGSIDSLNFAPESHTATWNLEGSTYSFSPTAFTAGTTLNVAPASTTVAAITATMGNCANGCIDANFTSSSTNSTDVELSNTTAGAHNFTFFSTGSANGPGYFGVFDGTAGNGPFAVTGGVASGPPTVMASETSCLGFSSSPNAFSGAADTCVWRDAAGVFDFGIGTSKSKTATLKAAQFVPSGSAPSCAAGAAAGAGATCSVSGTNVAGVLTLTSGTGTASAGTLVTITDSGTLNSAPYGCTLMPRNSVAAAGVAGIYTTTPTTTAWAVASGSVAPAASTVLSWSYQCE